jgi:hypothetical protein
MIFAHPFVTKASSAVLHHWKVYHTLVASVVIGSPIRYCREEENPVALVLS